MTDEQIISRFDAMNDEHALTVLRRVFRERFAGSDDACEAMDEAAKQACFLIAEHNGYRDEIATDNLICRVFGRAVKWWREAA